MAGKNYKSGNKANRSLDPVIDIDKIESLTNKEFQLKMKRFDKNYKTPEKLEAALQQELRNYMLSSKLNEAKYLVTRDSLSKSFVEQDKVINEINAFKFPVEYRN